MKSKSVKQRLDHPAEPTKTFQSRWWRLDGSPNDMPKSSRKGEACPKCLMDDLDYDTLFRLSCPICGYVADCGAFT